MGINKNWMIESNIGARRKNSIHAFRRAINHCLSTALISEFQKKIVGAGFERAKMNMSEDELEAIRAAKGEDWNKIRPI